MEICAVCYPSKLPSCNGYIFVRSGIAHFENYFWKITDKQGNVYTGECTPSYTNSLDFIINPNDSVFCKGMFQPFSGGYTLQVVDAYDQPQSLMMQGLPYGCIALEFYPYSGDDLNSLVE